MADSKHYSKPNLKQRSALAGQKCPSCNGQGTLRKDTVASTKLECCQCGDSFASPQISLR
ncbi:hypothetical protein [Vibrio harveyi]|uniref:hypothetical protein n=1 Tax=Vibrio harveyi TaxID=669 RepID=UPI003CF98468